MLKRLTVAAFAAAISIGSVAVTSQVAGAQEPPKGATPNDNPGASSGGGESMEQGSTSSSSTKKGTMKKHSKKKTM